MDIASMQKALLGIQDIQTTRYSQLSSSTIVIFDHIITFDDEVSLIWNSSWSLGKILFLLNRYYNLASVIFNGYVLFSTTLTDQVRVRIFQWQGWTGLIACMIAEAILLIRLYALYSLNKKVLAFMLITYISCSGVSAWIIATELASVSAILITSVEFCVPTGVSHRFYTFWIPMLSNECILCALALFQGFRTFKINGSMYASGRKLIRTLVRDSVLYFFPICAAYLTCLLIWVTARDTLREAPVGFSVAMSCVLANRVVLNVRKMSQNLNSRLPAPAMAIDDDRYPIRHDNADTSFFTPGELTVYEMGQLRTMRAERHFSKV